MNLERLIKLLPVVLIATTVWSCSLLQTDEVENELRHAEMAVAQGDMIVAKSVASHISADPMLSTLTPSQLGRLSLVYMQMADSADQAENISAATDCYHRAFQANADSAARFYGEVAPEHTAHAMMLDAIVRSLDAPADTSLLINEEPDSI